MNQKTLAWLCGKIDKKPEDFVWIMPYFYEKKEEVEYVFKGTLPCKKGVARVVRDGRVKYKKIVKPSQELKEIQQLVRDRILWPFLKRAKIRFDFAHGGFRKCSIKTHANPHANSRYFFVTDLSHAYESVKLGYLRECLENLGFYPDVVQTLVEINTHRDKLPIGFAASPLLFNLALNEFDNRIIARLAGQDRADIVYTRFYDDLIFSSQNEIGQEVGGIIADLLTEFGFKLKERKTFYGDVKKKAIKFTGLTITGKGIILSKKKRRNFEGFLHLAKKDPLGWKPKVAGKLGLFKMIYGHNLPRKIDLLLQEFDLDYADAWRREHNLKPL